MYLKRLNLEHFRNYAFLNLELEPGKMVLVGDNGQGKTNFLEAIYLLALTRSFRPGPERELICWHSPSPPLARVIGQFQLEHTELKLEVLVQMAGESLMEKGIKLNEKFRTARGVIGLVNVVLFGPQDLDIILGPPRERRRYLNILGCQLSPRYLEALQDYRVVLKQRNCLLRQVNEGVARPSELEVWDEKLILSGSFITEFRAELADKLNEKIREVPYRLSEGREELEISYRPSIGGRGDEIAFNFRKALQEAQGREVALQKTLYGPHRDELRFLLGGRDVAITGSRGQQRTTAIGLRLGEGKLIQEKRGEPPILLLDDIFSELDPLRCVRLVRELDSYQQVIITTTRKPSELTDQLDRAAWFQVKEGTIFRIK